MEIIGEVWNYWKSKFPDDELPYPKRKDIRVLESEEPIEISTFYWGDDNKEVSPNPSIAFCHSRKKKIILTSPLEEKYSYRRTLIHELGHWFFDRRFDEYGKTNISTDKKWDDYARSNGDYYSDYGEMVAMHIDEELCGKYWNESNISGWSNNALKRLRKIEATGKNVLLTIIGEYTQKVNEPNTKGWP